MALLPQHLRQLTIRLCTVVALGTLALGSIALQPMTARAQASIVPALHPVYDWLADQRVAGRLPQYQFEVRPMARAEIIAQLRTLAAMESSLSEGERRLLRDFRNEFEQERLEANRGFTADFFRKLPSALWPAIRDRRDPVIYAGTSADSMVSGAVYVAKGAGTLSLTNGSDRRSGYVTTGAVRGFLNTRFGLGWHFEADNIWTATDAALIRQLPRYDTEAMKPYSTSSYEYESFVSYRSPKYFELVMGRGSQAMGAGVTDPLILRADAPYFGMMRLRLGTPRFNFVYLHGALHTNAVDETMAYQGNPITSRVAPDRYLVSHRLTWSPHPRLSLALHEQMIYSNRGLDLNYLNPVVPMVLAQARLGDRDNLLMGGDVVFRPLNGTQLVGSVLIDDVGKPGDEGVHWSEIKSAMTVGIEQRLWPGMRLSLGYTATTPFVYSHWMRLNAYEDHDKPLGTALGPNGEELAARLIGWFPLRTRVMLGVRAIRRGLDPVNSAGVVTACVGGNLLCGKLEPGRPRYVGAEIHDIRRVELEAESEVIRGFPIAFRLRDDQVTRGTQLRSQRFVDLRFRFGF